MFGYRVIKATTVELLISNLNHLENKNKNILKELDNATHINLAKIGDAIHIYNKKKGKAPRVIKMSLEFWEYLLKLPSFKEFVTVYKRGKTEHKKILNLRIVLDDNIVGWYLL